MTNAYFDTPNWTRLARLTLARAEAVNAITDAIVTGFSTLPSPTDLKRNTTTFVATDTGLAGAYVITQSYAPASYTDGMEISFRVANTNAGATTVNVNGLGVIGLRNYAGNAHVGGECLAAAVVEARFDFANNYFRVTNPNVTNTGAITVNNLLKNSVADTTPGYFTQKLVTLGAIATRQLAAGGNEQTQVKLKQTAIVTATAQTAVVGSITRIDTSGGAIAAFNLPAIGAGDTLLQDGDVCMLQDVGGSVESNNVTIVGGAGNIIFMGQASAASLTWNGPNYSILTFTWKSATTTWIGTGND